MTDGDFTHGTGLPDRYASPCIRNCTLDPDDLCIGCGRTLGEILEWSQASSPRKLAIRDAAELRLRARASQYPFSRGSSA